MSKPFSQACVNNQQPILAILKRVFADSQLVLEVGSGTGQHGAYFAPRLPHLVWQPSDLLANLAGITKWVESADCDNLRTPILLDVKEEWPELNFDSAFTANTCHIMVWEAVEAMFLGLAERLPVGAVFCVYGPFLYEVNPSSNESFDKMLRSENQHMGVRRQKDILALANRSKWMLVDDHPMPANNRLLHFIRS